MRPYAFLFRSTRLERVSLITVLLLLGLFSSTPSYAQEEVAPGPQPTSSTMLQEYARILKELKSQRPSTRDQAQIARWFALRRSKARQFALEYEGKAVTPQELIILGQAQMEVPKIELALENIQKGLGSLPESNPLQEGGLYTLIVCHYRLKQYEALKKRLEEFRKRFQTSRLIKALDRMEKLLSLHEARSAMVSQIAPPLSPQRSIGSEMFTLQSLRGKVVLLDFWATWCAPCRRTLPHLTTFQKELGPQGLQVVGITRLYGKGFLEGKLRQNLDESEEQELNAQFHQKNGLNYPVLITDHSIVHAYKITGIPTIFLLDRQGKIRHVQMGAGKENLLRQKVEELLREAPSDESKGSGG